MSQQTKAADKMGEGSIVKFLQDSGDNTAHSPDAIAAHTDITTGRVATVRLKVKS